MIEFCESKDFKVSFAKIINHIKEEEFKIWEFEAQTIVTGNNAWSLNEEFFLGGGFLKGIFILGYVHLPQ